jgi:hypothetical protein
MKMIYKFTNPQMIPGDLAPGEYTTRVIETGWEDGDFVVILEYLGEINNDNNRCLFPLVKHATGWQPTYSDTYVDDITDYNVWDSYRNLDLPESENSTGIEMADFE